MHVSEFVIARRAGGVLLCEQEEWAIAERLSNEADAEWTDRSGRRRKVKGDQRLVARALRENYRLRALPQ